MKKGIYIAILIIGFVAVRIIGKGVFYDPLNAFFHIPDYQNHPMPDVEIWKYGMSLLFRYSINTVLTLALVKVIFDNRDLLKLTLVLYFGLFLLLIPVLLWLISNGEVDQYRYLFYIRRVLMHPILTLILIPAFLFNERSTRNTSL